MQKPMTLLSIAAKISADFGVSVETTQVGKFLDRVNFMCANAMAQGAQQAASVLAPDLPPVEGNQLPEIGTSVFIHLGSSDKWVEHRVVGYYVWGDLKKNPHLHRVFVRVVDKDGVLNARMLCKVKTAQEIAALGVQNGN